MKPDKDAEIEVEAGRKRIAELEELVRAQVLMWRAHQPEHQMKTIIKSYCQINRRECCDGINLIALTLGGFSLSVSIGAVNAAFYTVGMFVGVAVMLLNGFVSYWIKTKQ